MREVESIDHLGSALVLASVADDGDLVADLDALVLKQTLAGITCSAVSRIDTVDIEIVLTIADVDVAVGGLDNLGDGSGHHVPVGRVDILCKEIRD